MKQKSYTAGEWALMIGAAVLMVGGAFGIFLMILSFAIKYGKDIHGEEVRGLAAAAFWCIAGGCLVLCGISTAAGRKSGRLLKAWDGEESPLLDRQRSLMDILNYFFELFFVLLFMAAGFRVFAEGPDLAEGESEWIKIGGYLLAFILLTIVLYAFQRMLRDARSDLAESEGGCVYSGGVFSTKDMKEWARKSDEGERQLVYEAAFRACRRTIRILFLAMAFICYTKLQGPVTITAFTVTGIIWILLSASFCIERNRLRKQRPR